MTTARANQVWPRLRPGIATVRRRRPLTALAAAVVVVVVLTWVLVARHAARADAFTPMGVADAGQVVNVGQPVTVGLVQLVNTSGHPVQIVRLKLVGDRHGHSPLRVLSSGVLVGQDWAGGVINKPLSQVLPGAKLSTNVVVPPHRAGDTFDALVVFEVTTSRNGISWMPTQEVTYTVNGVEHRQRFEQGTSLCSPASAYSGPGKPNCTVDRTAFAAQ